MTCYFRHLKGVFEKASIQVTPENKKEIDRMIHNIVNVEYKNCPDTWRQVKILLQKDETDFVSILVDAWSKHNVDKLQHK